MRQDADGRKLWKPPDPHMGTADPTREIATIRTKKRENVCRQNG